MKRKLLLLILLFLIFSNKSFSQDKKIKFQLSIGPTISLPKTSKLVDSNIKETPQIKSSINIGAYLLPNLNYSINEKFSFDFGLGFYLDRFSIEDKNGRITNKGNRNISQIQTPINANFHFGSNNSYIFGIGGFTNFLLSAKEKGKTTTDFSTIDDLNDPDPSILDNTQSISYDKNIKDNYNSINFGAFIQLKKNIILSTNTNGFLIIKINQYFNSIKNNDSKSILNIEYKNEKESTTISFGIGIEL